jgi:virulence-associated protein VagC
MRTAGLTLVKNRYHIYIYMKATTVFKSGGSYAVRLPKAWVPASGKVYLHREGNRIIITEQGSDLRELAASFAQEGLLEFDRPPQPSAGPSRKL